MIDAPPTGPVTNSRIAPVLLLDFSPKDGMSGRLLRGPRSNVLNRTSQVGRTAHHHNLALKTPDQLFDTVRDIARCQNILIGRRQVHQRVRVVRGSSLNTPGESQTANQVAPVQIQHGINAGNPWFSQASFTQPTGAVFGTTGRNILSGPGLFSLNLSLFKDFKVTERIGVQLRCETFNFTNTPEFSNPSTGLTSSTYGYVTGTIGSGTGVNGTGGGRAVQLGAKVTF